MTLPEGKFEAIAGQIVAGLDEVPVADDYVTFLISLPYRVRNRPQLDALLARDERIPEVLLRFFEVEGNAEFSLASVAKYSHGPCAWTAILLDFCARGTFSRALLLERTLGTLERGWIQHRSGWFSRFHETLAPNGAEMRPHLPRYLGLCASRIPPTVTLALKALATLDRAAPLESAPLLDALASVASSAIQGQVLAALALLAKVVGRDPGAAPRAAAVALPALAHPAREVQAKTLQLLRQWGAGADHAEALRDHLPAIAAVHRPLLLELLGGLATATPAPEPPRLEPPAGAPFDPSPLAAARRLDPVRGCLELVELIAHVFENDHDVDGFERAIAGLIRLGPLPRAEQALFSPVLKRAGKLRRPLPQELARLLVFCLMGERRPAAFELFPLGYPNPMHQVLARRIDELIEAVAQGTPFTPLATPTHAGGFIDAAVFAERVAEHLRAGRRGRLEPVLGLLRLAITDQGREAARALPDAPLTRALRYALGETGIAIGTEEELYTAAARVRAPGADDPELLLRFGDRGPDGALAASYFWQVTSRASVYEGRTYTFHDFSQASATAPPATPLELLTIWRHPRADSSHRSWRFGGADAALVRYSATVQPGDLTAFFAEGARVVGDNLEWPEAQWQNRAYLDVLLQPTARIQGPGAILLWLGLASKEPGHSAVAAEALVQGAREGRLDQGELASELARLLATPLLKAPRLARALQAALRADTAMEERLFDLLGEAFRQLADGVGTDIANLLELLLELKTRLRRLLPAATAAALAALPLGGRAAKLRSELSSGSP